MDPGGALPTLGVGLTYCSGLDAVLEQCGELVGVIEVEPQTLWRDPGAERALRVDHDTLERLADLPYAKLLHGIGFPVGGTRPPSSRQIPPLLEMIGALQVPWMSEHLSFNLAMGPHGPFNTGFMLPPRQTPDGVVAAVRSIRTMADAVPIPLAVETGVSYLRPRRDELDDGAFVAAVVEGADCGIVLDLHNVWTNQRNGRQRVEDFLRQIPRERVWEVHLAGGSERSGYWVDSHSGPAPEELIKLALEIVPELPALRALIFELFPAYLQVVGPDMLPRQLEALHAVWEARGSRTPPRFVPSGAARRANAPPAAAEWEDVVGALVVGREASGDLAREIAADPGVALVRDLLGEFRAGMVVSVLPLTLRLLLLSVGETEVRRLLAEYWADASPELFAAAEAAGFARSLAARQLDVPYLSEVLAYEDAVRATLLDGVDRLVEFEHDPLPLLRALGRGQLPDQVSVGRFEIEVTGTQAISVSGG